MSKECIASSMECVMKVSPKILGLEIQELRVTSQTHWKECLIWLTYKRKLREVLVLFLPAHEARKDVWFDRCMVLK